MLKRLDMQEIVENVLATHPSDYVFLQVNNYIAKEFINLVLKELKQILLKRTE